METRTPGSAGGPGKPTGGNPGRASRSDPTTELADETVADHLLVVFEPDDRQGSDGQVHLEGDRLACLCGFAASTPDDLDAHFLKVFTPGDGTGHDGKKHGATDGG